jgi:hypothetical protein
MANLKGILAEYEQTRVIEGEDRIHAHLETSAGHFVRVDLKSDGSFGVTVGSGRELGQMVLEGNVSNGERHAQFYDPG